jgi:hypothetical protein
LNPTSSELGPPLTDHELDELIRTAPPKLRREVERLCAEVRLLREQQSAREFQYNQEIAW